MHKLAPTVLATEQYATKTAQNTAEAFFRYFILFLCAAGASPSQAANGQLTSDKLPSQRVRSCGSAVAREFNSFNMLPDVFGSFFLGGRRENVLFEMRQGKS